MKAIYINLFLLCSVFFTGHAQPVSAEKAKQIGVAFFNGWQTSDDENPTLRAMATETTVQTRTWKQRNRDCMYAINFPDSGWVLVSGDERTMPILAMSNNRTFPDREDMPPAMLALFEDYADEIMFIQDSASNAIIHPDWYSLENDIYSMQSRNIDNGNGSSLYTPGIGLLNRPNRGEVRWNQSYNNSGGCEKAYNKFCPDEYSPSCGRTYVGCTAVAMAQIMWYWQWPHTGYVHSDIDKKGNGQGAMELHLYDWKLMPAELRITPNPTDGSLTVQSPKGINRIELYDLNGEKVLESRETTLELHPLPNGMYIVMVHFADGTLHSEKVIKQE